MLDDAIVDVEVVVLADECTGDSGAGDDDVEDDGVDIFAGGNGTEEEDVFGVVVEVVVLEDVVGVFGACNDGPEVDVVENGGVAAIVVDVVLVVDPDIGVGDVVAFINAANDSSSEDNVEVVLGNAESGVCAGDDDVEDDGVDIFVGDSGAEEEDDVIRVDVEVVVLADDCAEVLAGDGGAEDDVVGVGVEVVVVLVGAGVVASAEDVREDGVIADINACIASKRVDCVEVVVVLVGASAEDDDFGDVVVEVEPFGLIPLGNNANTDSIDVSAVNDAREDIGIDVIDDVDARIAGVKVDVVEVVVLVVDPDIGVGDVVAFINAANDSSSEDNVEIVLGNSDIVGELICEDGLNVNICAFAGGDDHGAISGVAPGGGLDAVPESVGGNFCLSGLSDDVVGIIPVCGGIFGDRLGVGGGKGLFVIAVCNGIVPGDNFCSEGNGGIGDGCLGEPVDVVGAVVLEVEVIVWGVVGLVVAVDDIPGICVGDGGGRDLFFFPGSNRMPPTNAQMTPATIIHGRLLIIPAVTRAAPANTVTTPVIFFAFDARDVGSLDAATAAVLI